MKRYFECLRLAAVAVLFIVSCSNDSSDDQESTPESGVIKLVITLDELLTDSKMGVILIPVSDFKNGVTSATYTNINLTEDTLLDVGISDFDYTSTVHTFVTSDEVHTLQTQLLLPSFTEGEETAYTIEIFFDDVLEHTSRNVIGPDTKEVRAFKWSSDEGFEDDNFNSSL